MLTACGRRFDEVIRHVALTLDPHVREQDGFQALMEARRDGGFYFSAGDAVAEEKEPEAGEAEEEWDAEYVDALPDESFAYIEPGGEADEEGKTVPRELRHFPVRDAEGNVSLPHVEEALAALDAETMSTGEPIPEEDRERVREELEALLEEGKPEGEQPVGEDKAAVEAESARSRPLARFLGKLGFKGEGAPSKSVARMETRLDGLSARLRGAARSARAARDRVRGRQIGARQPPAGEARARRPRPHGLRGRGEPLRRGAGPRGPRQAGPSTQVARVVPEG